MRAAAVLRAPRCACTRQDGDEACFFATIAPRRHVIAVEPMPQNIAVLNSLADRIPRLKVVSGGLGRFSGMASFPAHLLHAPAGIISQTRCANNTCGLHFGAAGGEQQHVHRFPAHSIDQHWPTTRFGLLHIDVEGREAAVLRGAWRTLRRDAPMLILSLYPQSKAAAAQKLSLLLAELGCVECRARIRNVV
jgi:FkbM family methyltransferase